MVVPGQVGALYLAEPTDEQIARLVATISEHPWCGPVFTRAGNEIDGMAPGSLGNHLVFADHARAPDVSFSFRADDGVDPFGLIGGTFYDNDRRTGLGVHGGLHPKELAALGIVAGSAFPAAGSVSTAPSGICDFAPTILHLLEIGRPNTMNGRVLHELLWDPDRANAAIRHESFEAKLGRFRQVLRRVQVGDATYVESGTAEG
ncbi:hypothetical protein PYH37_006303 (plasmid) [Sinorhizobium numidicum]|uniref:hypothetical protein n=1 Tax=Sinorhizobium numidicum TaxID=680248 RepID=UPI0024741F3F|nr:hypothetical protein [Sinorhizobium numidicum]WEX79401.1 hypothetical protein PYH37_006303 [Sinorhizobium numidicum]